MNDEFNDLIGNTTTSGATIDSKPSNTTSSESYDPLAALMAPPARSSSYGVSLSSSNLQVY